MTEILSESHNSPRQSQLRIEDAAELLGWSVTHLRRLIKTEELHTVGGPDTVLWADVRRLALRSHRLPLLATEEQMTAGDPPSWMDLKRADGRTPTLPTNTVTTGNCCDWLKKMPDRCVQAVVTSPPYWGVRRYADKQEVDWSDGSKVAFGQEKLPEDYVRHTLEILWHLRRVVREDGVVWWNVGDTYMTRSHVRADSLERLDALEGRRGKESWKNYPVKRYSAGHPYLKDKDLTLVPFQIALGAQRLGWYVRSITIWAKANTLPESVRDRPTTAHEYILMLTKARFYKYHTEAATEDAISDWGNTFGNDSGRRNMRTVWTFATSTDHGNHVAAFPVELPKRCLLASTDPDDLVFDPFAGSGTTLVAAKQLGRRYFGCDISPTYVREALDRLKGVPGIRPDDRPDDKFFQSRLLERRSTFPDSTSSPNS